MLVIGSKLIGQNVLSLQVGGQIASTVEPIIDPSNLKIIAYTLAGPLVDKSPENVLLTNDIREFSTMGFIIDAIDDLVDPNEIIKIRDILKLNFKLIGHRVETQKGKKIGKVIDFTVDSATFSIYQLIVKRPALKALNDPELTINRSQIVEIDDDKVIIKNEEETVRVPEITKEQFSPDFINPFRKQKTPAPAEATQTK